MFETIAMICYLSITEPQTFEAPVFDQAPITSVYTGTHGGDPDDPKKEKEN